MTKDTALMSCAVNTGAVVHDARRLQQRLSCQSFGYVGSVSQGMCHSLLTLQEDGELQINEMH